MALIVFLLFILFAAITYFAPKNPVKAILFVIASHFFIPFLEVKFASSNISGVVLNVFLVYILAVYSILKKRVNRIVANPIILYLVLAHIYFLIMAVLKDVYWLNYINEFRRYLNGVIILVIIMISGLSLKDTGKEVKNVLISIFLIEISIALLIYIGPQQINNFFNVHELIENNVAIRSNLISGTLTKPNHFANTLAIIFFVIIFLFQFQKNKIIENNRFVLFLLLSSSAIFLSGVRTSLISFIFGLGLYFVKYKKKLGIIIAVIGLFVIISSNILNNQTDFRDSTKNATTGIERMEGITVLFKGLNYISENRVTNLWLSFDVLSYFPDNIIFGGNRYYKQGYGWIQSKNNNSTDATLALLLTEHGLLGFFLFMFPFLFVLRRLWGQNKNHFYFNLLFFTVLFLQTISDLGLFHQVSSSLYFLVSGLQINENKGLQATNEKINNND